MTLEWITQGVSMSDEALLKTIKLFLGSILGPKHFSALFYFFFVEIISCVMNNCVVISDSCTNIINAFLAEEALFKHVFKTLKFYL